MSQTTRNSQLLSATPVPQATHAAGLGEIQIGEGSVVVSNITLDVSDAVEKRQYTNRVCYKGDILL